MTIAVLLNQHLDENIYLAKLIEQRENIQKSFQEQLTICKPFGVNVPFEKVSKLSEIKERLTKCRADMAICKENIAQLELDIAEEIKELGIEGFHFPYEDKTFRYSLDADNALDWRRS